jgi:uncharacterized protein (DUF2141 family)
MIRGFLRAAMALPFAALVLTLASGPAQPSETIDITVVIENLRSSSGDVRVALWSRADGFTDPDAAVAEAGQKAHEGQVAFTFKGLTPGRYAIASFHDENGNGSFDRTFLGLPKEGLGFSNGARIFLGPPTFDAAAVEVAAASRVLVVKLLY